MLEVEEKHQSASAKQFGIKILFAFVYFPHTPIQSMSTNSRFSNVYWMKIKDNIS